MKWFLFAGAWAFGSSDGSPFIGLFCSVLKKEYKSCSLLEMIQMVIEKMKNRTLIHKEKRMTVPSFNGSTWKSIYFGKCFN